MGSLFRTAATVLAVAELAAGCHLLFEAKGYDAPEPTDADPFMDAPRSDQPLIRTFSMTPEPIIDIGLPVPPSRVTVEVTGIRDMPFVHLCETVAGAEFGGFNVPANGTGQLDGAGRGTFETMWTPTGFGRVTVRCRVAYDAVENGNLGDHKFAVQQAVGNYGPLIGDTFTLFPDKVHAFAIRFTRSGHVVKMGMLANNSSVSARFGLYNTNTDSPPNPTTPVFPPPNPVQLNGRVELAVDHTVSAGDTLFVLINLSSDLVVSHRSVSQQNPDTRTTGMITFPNLVDPWQGHIATLNGDFPVYVAIEPL